MARRTSKNGHPCRSAHACSVSYEAGKVDVVEGAVVDVSAEMIATIFRSVLIGNKELHALYTACCSEGVNAWKAARRSLPVAFASATPWALKQSADFFNLTAAGTFALEPECPDDVVDVVDDPLLHAAAVRATPVRRLANRSSTRKRPRLVVIGAP
jgi:hypothetical protein